MNMETVDDIMLALQGWLGRHFANARITQCRRAPSGMSNETYIFTLSHDEAGTARTRDLVARWAPASGGQYEVYDLEKQFRILEALKQSGVPVPEALFLETDASAIGRPFYVMEFIEGESAPDREPGYHGHGLFFEASAEGRVALWWEALDTMAKVNRLDWRRLLPFFDAPASGGEALQRRIDLMRSMIAWVQPEPVPLFDRALDWLERHNPQPEELEFCWSDGRPGNMLFRDGKVVAALDWEGAYIGPVENEIAFFLTVDEVAYRNWGTARMPELPGDEETVARYERQVGRKMKSLPYYRIMQSAWLAMMIMVNVRNAMAADPLSLPAEVGLANPSSATLERLLGEAERQAAPIAS